MKKYVIVIIVIFFVVLIMWRILPRLTGSGAQTARSERPPVAVETETVSYGPIRDVREFTGSVYPIYQYVVAPKVSGRVVEISKRIGDNVRRGEIIARIDDAEYQQAVLEAEANLKIAEASLAESKSQLELSSQELERVQSLQEKGIASPSELDAAQSNFNAQQSRFKLAQAQVEQREAALSSAKIRLGYTTLQVSEEGFVGERFVDEGALLAPNSPVITVIGLDTVIIRTTIIERDYGLIKTGQKAEIEVDSFPGEVFTGSVSRIAPMLREDTRVAQMEIEVSNASRKLKPGMFTRVRVILNEKDSALTVSSQALIRRNGGNGIFTIDEQKKIAHFVPVKVGIIAKNSVEILEPELSGLVVTLGQHLLAEGSPVILPETGKSESSGGNPRQTSRREAGQ